jgi:hypothetical protein
MPAKMLLPADWTDDQIRGLFFHSCIKESEYNLHSSSLVH